MVYDIKKIDCAQRKLRGGPGGGGGGGWTTLESYGGGLAEGT